MRIALITCVVFTAIGGVLSNPLFQWANSTVAGTPLLQEAIAITGFDIQTFVNSEPYKNDSNIITIKKDLNSISDRE